MRWWTTIPGVLIVAFALSEMFQDLFHPTESGTLSLFVGRKIFNVLRRHPQALPLAGPLALVLVILSWATLLAVGFSLIYIAGFPGDFRLSTGKAPNAEHGFWPAFYFSLEVLTTLGLGDVTPQPGWLRILVTFQALIGFALITASVSWVVLIYPALSRMRCLARRASILREAKEKTSTSVLSGDSEYLLYQFTQDMIRARVDLIHFPILYFFRSDHVRADLAHSVPLIAAMAELGSAPDCSPGVRLTAAALRLALNDYADVLADKFVDADKKDSAAVFRAYAEHHAVPQAHA